MIRVPAKILYPGMVIALLLMSLGFVTATVVAAHSDGGPQVVEDYYEKSQNYDRIRAEKTAARRTGWSIETSNFGHIGADGAMHLTVLDADGRPVTGLEGRVELWRPELSGAVASARLRSREGQPGQYVADLAPNRIGVWDIVLDVERARSNYLFEVRREVTR